MSGLSRTEIERLLRRLNEKLSHRDSRGELYLVGGAVMCLVFSARPSTRDLDGVFAPSTLIREAAREIAAEEDLPAQWLNDGVKGFLSEHGDFSPYLTLSNLTVFTPSPEYLFAMKSLAMRLGAEFHDEDDLRFLIRLLNLESYDEALAVVTRYYPAEKIPQKTLYALEELLST